MTITKVWIKLMKHEWKKQEKEFYAPKQVPQKVILPSFKFFTIAGEGNPNNAFFSDYIAVLYSLAYAVKMSPKQNKQPEGYFDYTVYPLEGVWDLIDKSKYNPEDRIDKDNLKFTLMIRQPSFVSDTFAREIIEMTKEKKPSYLLDNVLFDTIEEGACVQMLHIGSYDDKPASFGKMEAYCTENNLQRKSKMHREIYLSDARKTTPQKLKTILRFQIL